jgi:hypothetical protein
LRKLGRRAAYTNVNVVAPVDMTQPPVCDSLKECRAVAGAHPLDESLGSAAHRDDVVTVYQRTLHSMRVRETDRCVVGLTQRYVHVARKQIVFNDEQHRQLHSTRKVHRLMDYAFLDGSIAQVRNRDSIHAPHLGSQGSTHRQRHGTRHDWYRPIKAVRLIP